MYNCNNPVKSLRTCANDGECSSCMIFPESNHLAYCESALMNKAADAFEELIAEKEKLENSGKLLIATFEQAKAELQKYKHAAFMIGEICVDESKRHISPEDAIKKIREQIYYGGHPCELPPHGDLIDLSAKVDCQYYDEMYEEWSVRTVTVEDVLRGCLEKMPPVVIPASEGAK